MSEIIAGRNNVMAALEGERSLTKILVSRSIRGNIQPLLNLAKERGCPLQFVPREKLDEMAKGLNHQGILAEAAAWKYYSLDELLADLDISANPILLLLAGVEDPHNLGALLRSGECAGVDGVILPKRRSAQLTETVARVSMGAIESVPVCRVGNLAQTLDALKARGFWVAAADMEGDNFWQVKWNFPVVLILGSEGSGVPRLLKEKSDYIVSIPTRGRVNSLNVSVAGAVLVYEMLRQRIAPDGISDN
ncbi:MAG: 23S rRNA (guanosine(2251)-2'-O)-methyltransferase RlmB [Eubacteriales bacterium]|nr:23S rRNA (guanosine(2251)-2'-O)-methyltransferase RlmB [Eubacteriales bacterium]